MHYTCGNGNATVVLSNQNRHVLCVAEKVVDMTRTETLNCNTVHTHSSPQPACTICCIENICDTEAIHTQQYSASVIKMLLTMRRFIGLRGKIIDHPVRIGTVACL